MLFVVLKVFFEFIGIKLFMVKSLNDGVGVVRIVFYLFFEKFRRENVVFVNSSSAFIIFFIGFLDIVI